MANRSTNWFKWGCLGCLGLVGLAAILAALFVFIPAAVERTRDREPVHRELAGPPPPPDEPAAPPGVELPAEAPPSTDTLRLDLDLSVGSFQIEPGRPGEPIRVEADYDARAFELEESFDAASNTYRVSFDSKGGFFGLFGRRVDSDTRVRVTVPPDRPVALVGEIGVGESRFELGGLWLTDVDLELGTGEHHLEVGEPLRQPLPRFSLDAGVGETRIRSLGNASPAEVAIDQGIGELSVELDGAWQGDSQIHLDLGIGECSVEVPEGVEVVVEHASVGLGESSSPGLRRRGPAPEGAPTLRIRAEAGIGEVRIE